MDVVNIINSQDVNGINLISMECDQNQDALNSVSEWESRAPVGEDRASTANKIRDVIARNATDLDLSHVKISSLPDVLPHSITELKIYDCTQLSALPDSLPSGMTNLSVDYCDELSSLFKNVPENLIELHINGCPKITTTIISLPDSLQSISLFMSSEERLPLPFEKLPENLKSINLSYCFLVDKLDFSNAGIQLNGIVASTAMEFKLGDIIYGIAQYRGEIVRQVVNFNDFSNKDIFSQIEITDTVWEHRSHLSRDKYQDDAIIKEKLNDAERAIQFKKFLEKHNKYNIIERPGIKSYRPHRSEEDICLSRTSKAGLEFQIMERQGRVFFCADGLVNRIPEIAQKKPNYGTCITASELRWLYRHQDHPNVKNNVQFCLDGAFISQEEVFSLAGWENYHPKSKTHSPHSYA
ncbi:type III secretion protein GogB [Yersinia kristensenii]|uniref:type III secretion protein GogB n=1 Tax=Yersinia kristensenii TaxID=28152 RepID=UPI0005E62050|nr:type III secretion protein GogB [Yersinia kristensenii]CNH31163.1 type III secretion protein GogB [Yersinia kristensenii]CNK75379.1 type III secretion protein GogB [Yersinia kristensenii]